MGPEKDKQEKKENKPVAMPFRKDQTGISQANQSIWGEGGAGKVLVPPPEAVPGTPPGQDEK